LFAACWAYLTSLQECKDLGPKSKRFAGAAPCKARVPVAWEGGGGLPVLEGVKYAVWAGRL